MIELSRINKVDKFWVNEDRIEFMEAAPDTIISMESGKKVAVAESIGEVIEKVIEYKRKITQAYRDPRG